LTIIFRVGQQGINPWLVGTKDGNRLETGEIITPWERIGLKSTFSTAWWLYSSSLVA
jgi:hypothetical protein